MQIENKLHRIKVIKTIWKFKRLQEQLLSVYDLNFIDNLHRNKPLFKYYKLFQQLFAGIMNPNLYLPV